MRHLKRAGRRVVRFFSRKSTPDHRKSPVAVEVTPVKIEVRGPVRISPESVDHAAGQLAAQQSRGRKLGRFARRGPFNPLNTRGRPEENGPEK